MGIPGYPQNRRIIITFIETPKWWSDKTSLNAWVEMKEKTELVLNRKNRIQTRISETDFTPKMVDVQKSGFSRVPSGKPDLATGKPPCLPIAFFNGSVRLPGWITFLMVVKRKEALTSNSDRGKSFRKDKNHLPSARRCPSSLAKLVKISPISLWLMEL